MKKPFLIGICFALLWCLIKSSFFLLNYDQPDFLKWFVMLNMFLATLTVSLSIYESKKRLPGQNLLMDVKNGISGGLIYTVAVSFFIFFYYQNINPQYNIDQLEKREKEISLALDDPKNIADIQSQKPEWRSLSKAELVVELKNNAAVFFSPKFTMTIALLALLLYATVNSLLIALIFRKFLFSI